MSAAQQAEMRAAILARGYFGNGGLFYSNYSICDR